MEEAARFEPSERVTKAGGGDRRRAGSNPSRRAPPALRPSVRGRMGGWGWGVKVGLVPTHFGLDWS